MSNKVDDFNRFVDVVGNIIKVTSTSVDIAHIVSDVLKNASKNDNQK